MKITDEEVATACEALLARDVTPTVRAVLVEIGRGSHTDVAPLVKIWKADHAEAMKLEAVPVPDEVSRSVSQLVARVWLAAQDAASATVALRDAELEDVRAQAEAEGRELGEVIAQLEAEQEAGRKQVRKLAADLAKTEKQLAGEQAEVIRLEERVAGRDREVERCVAMAAAAEARAAQAEAREADMRAEMVALQARPIDGEAGAARHAAE